MGKMTTCLNRESFEKSRLGTKVLIFHGDVSKIDCWDYIEGNGVDVMSWDMGEPKKQYVIENIEKPYDIAIYGPAVVSMKDSFLITSIRFTRARQWPDEPYKPLMPCAVGIQPDPPWEL